MKLNKFDFRALQHLFSSKAADDLNRFLENLPKYTGQTVLLAATIVWISAGVVGLFTTVQIQRYTELRAELEEAEALKPIVPEISETPVSKEQLETFVERAKEAYRGVKIELKGKNTIRISAKATSNYTEFREAVGHVLSSGHVWKITLDEMCLGRECSGQKLMAVLRVSEIKVK